MAAQLLRCCTRHIGFVQQRKYLEERIRYAEVLGQRCKNGQSEASAELSQYQQHISHIELECARNVTTNADKLNHLRKKAKRIELRVKMLAAQARASEYDCHKATKELKSLNKKVCEIPLLFVLNFLATYRCEKAFIANSDIRNSSTVLWYSF